MINFLFILGLNFNFLCFCVCLCVIICIKQKKIKSRPRVKLNLPCEQRLHFRCANCRAKSSNLLIVGTLRNYDGDGKGNVKKKAIDLMSKSKILHVHHAFLYITLQSLNNYDAK